MTNALTLRQRRSLSEIISASFGIYGNSTLRFNLLVLSLPGLIFGLCTIALREWLPDWTSGFPVFFLGFLESAILGSSAMYYLDQAQRGNDISSVAALGRTWYQFPDLAIATVLSFAIIGLLCITVVGIPFALMRLVRWSFTAQAVMIDEQDGDQALGYSARVVEGRWWSTALALVVLYTIQYLPAFLFLETLKVAIDDQPVAVLGLLIAALLFPFGVSARTLLYYDLKMRKALA